MMPQIKPRWSLVQLLLITTFLHSSRPESDSSSVGSRATPSLRFLIVVSRHGNRAPLFGFPSFPYPSHDRTAWPYGAGQLTKRGREQMYTLGVKVRSLYNGFVNEKYYKESFLAYSTNVDRTLMSAQSFLAGLFPPKDFQVWNEKLLWQPVPIYNTLVDHTALLAEDPRQLCPKFAQAQSEAMAKFYAESGPNMTSLLESLLPYSGMEPSSTSKAISVRQLWDPLVCADTEGLPLPSWAKDVYPERLESLMTNIEVAATIDSEDMIKLLQGELFKEMALVLEQKANGTLNPDREMLLYSGHDMTIRGLQGVLGLKDSLTRIIRPGSALALELHQDIITDQHFIQVLYIDGSTAELEPTTVTIPGCDVPCPLDVLLNITKKYYDIKDYSGECHGE